ncbi:MAG: hypothetical protein JW849_00735 [Phycisphaerae bacterium]|nr:hypothetical protein [Phycisphaerae bacterium]
MKHTAITLAVLVLFSSLVSAEKQLREIQWDAVQDAPWGEYGRVIPAKDGEPARLVVENPRNEIANIPLLTIENPGIGDVRWALHGKIRCQDVLGNGYLEMWSHFPNGAKCYTRTNSVTGPMRWVSGSTGWRVISLPFYSDKSAPLPVKLTVHLHLPNTGKVELGPMSLWEYTGNENPLTPPGAWWSDTMGGWIGGGIGFLYAFLGGAVGILAARGKGWKFAMGVFPVIFLIGGVSLAAGVIALVTEQTYGVWYPLFLLGGLSIIIFIPLFFTVRRRYAQLELRKMQAMDA